MATTLLHEGTNDYTALIGAATGQSIGEKTVTIPCGGCYVENDLQVKVKAYASYGTFSNLVLSGTEGQYTENTSDNTIIPTGGYLYLSGGYYPKTKISLAHLIPDSGTATLLDYDTGVSYIRSGKSAWDKNGKEIVGTLADTSLSISGGALSSNGLVLGSSTMSITPSFDLYTGTGTAAKTSSTKITDSTYGIIAESSVPTTGTYIRIDPNASASAVAPSVSIEVTRGGASISGGAGYYAGDGTGLAADTYSTSGNTTVSPSVQAGTNKYIKDVTNTHTFSGGSISQGAVSITSSSQSDGRGDYQIGITPSTVITKADSSAITESTYGIITSVPSVDNAANYLKLNPEATEGRIKLDVSIPITRAAITESCEAGLTQAKNGASAISSDTSFSATTSKTISALPDAGVNKYIPIVRASTSGGGLNGDSSITVDTKTVTFTPSVNVYTRVNTTDSTTAVDSTYGIITSVPTSGNYVWLDPSGTHDAGTNGIAVGASIGVGRNAVTVTCGAGITAGGGNGLSALDPTTYSGTGYAKGSVANGTNKYIPIVVASASGGGLNVDDNVSVETKTVTFTPSVTAKNDSGSNVESSYGIVTSKVSGTSYVTLDPDGTHDAGSNGIAVGASIGVGRNAVTVSSSAGITAGGNGNGLAAITKTNKTGTGYAKGSVANGTNKYIPIVSPKPSGGGIPDSSNKSITVSGDGTINVSPTVSLKNSSSVAVTESSFGITESAPSGSYMILDPDASGDGTKNISASVSITRDAITASSGAGITTGAGTGTIIADTKTYTGSGSVGINVKTTGNKYIALVSPSGSVSTHTTSNASATMSTAATTAGGGRAAGVAAPSGVLSSTPGDLSSYAPGYIQITPSLATSNGSATAKATGSIGAGITSGGTSIESAADTKSVGVTTTTTNAKTYYIKIYGGTYTVA